MTSINASKPIISIIVPYYQHNVGILTKSIESALQQRDIDPIALEIFIIDDASPLNVRDELPSAIQALSNIHIIEQSNTGPAGARNTGLNAIPKQTRYIAFLDSDDAWEPYHLAQAWQALEAGYDFYFSDFYQLDQTISAFNRAKRIDVNNHPLLFSDNTVLHQYVGNMQEQIVTGNIIGTSTVVYRYQHKPHLRFREDLVRAGEDYLFWLSLTTDKTKIAFSSKNECIYGKGVNIYSGTQYGTPEYLELVYYEIKYRKTILKEFNLKSEVLQKLQRHIKTQQENFIRAWVNQLITQRQLHSGFLIKYFKLCPSALFLAPYYLLKIIKEKL